MIDSTPPRLSASIKIFVASANRLRLLGVPATSNETMPPKAAHLLGASLVIGVRGKPGIVDLARPRVSLQELGDGLGVRAVPLHAEGERLHAS